MSEALNLDELVNEMDEATTKAQAIRYTYNAFWNTELIRRVWQRSGPFLDISHLPKATGKPALVCASGPSLNDWRDLITKWPGAIFAGASILPFFAEERVDPTYTVIVDDNPLMGLLVGESRQQVSTHILTHPCADPGLFSYERLGFFLMLNSYLQASHCLRQVYKTIAGQPGIVSAYTGGANYVTVAMLIAHHLGYSPIYFAGYDLAYIDGMARWNLELPDAGSDEDPPGSNGARYQAGPVVDGRILPNGARRDEDTGLMTDIQMLVYQKATLEAIERFGVEVVNTGRGLFRGLDYMSPLVATGTERQRASLEAVQREGGTREGD